MSRIIHQCLQCLETYIMKTSSVHIVRRYGLVGGMENYVLELTQALAKKGHTVKVLCETNEYPTKKALIEVVELGNHFKKPRWLAQWNFSKRVSEHLKSKKHHNVIVHSHERSSDHHVTTFHGPPFLNRKRRALDFLSPRISMWTQLEKQELLGDQVKVILPNSPLIAQQLASYYPSVANKIGEPAYPGVSALYAQKKDRNNNLTIGFIGREWKRKGLDIACQIVKQLQTDLPELHFLVVGCDPDEVRHLFNDFADSSYTLAGWSDTPSIFLQEIDLLLHPARAEPFGMAIAEANAAGIPVIVSEHCGIADLISEEQGKVCNLGSNSPNIEDWAQGCHDLLTNPIEVKTLGLTWEKLADQHINLYQSLHTQIS